MDGYVFDDDEKGGAGGFGSIKEGGVGKSASLARKRLSDITNQQTHLKSLSQDEKLRPYSFATKEYIEKLQKENITLRQLLQESTRALQDRNKLLESAGLELTKLRVTVQKLQQQNRLLAQANSQMTMERTLDKDRMRVMQHELGCRGALLAAKDMEFQDHAPFQTEEVKKKRRQKACIVKKHEDVTVEASLADGGAHTGNDASEEINEDPAPDDCGDAKQCRSRRSRIQSSGSSVVKEQVVPNKKPKIKRRSAGVKYDEQEPTAVIVDNKRPCLRRQSARFNSDTVGPTKDNCAIEDGRIPTSMLLDENMQDRALEVQLEAMEKADKESDQVTGDHTQAHVGDNEAHKFHRSLRSRTQSLGSSDGQDQVMVKEKPESRRHKQSASFNSEQVNPCEDVFEMEDARFPIGSLGDKSMQVDANSAREGVKEGKDDWNRDTDTPGLRTSMGRPLRRAAGKVQSYKEIPLNIKMRRAE